VAEVHTVEFVAQVAPGVAAGGFGEANEQQGQPHRADRTARVHAPTLNALHETAI
jgi:hypothetical protein